jgi:predicted ATPase
LIWLGELTTARVHLAQAIALYDPRQHRSLAFASGTDPGVHCLSYAALTLWLLGYPDQARKRSHEGLALAQELSPAFSPALALYFAAWLHWFSRDIHAVQERAEAAVIQGFPFWSTAGTILLGWALAEQGQKEGGIAQLRQGLAAYRATGAEMKRPCFLAMLAEACEKGGEAEEGLNALAEALALVDKTGERWWEAELHRLKGELLRRRASPTEEVEACFHQALDIARRQQAKSLELRAAMSLSRLWQQQGQRADARELLAPIHGWFTEGFDTADLQEAKALLEELSRYCPALFIQL